MKNLSPEQQIQKTLFEEIVQNKIFNDLKSDITEKLVFLLVNGPSLYDGFEKVGALNFEIDSYIEMHYIGYPFYLYDHTWKKNYHVDVRLKEKYALFEKIKTDFIKDQNSTEEEIEAFLYNATYDAELRNFCHCWQEAKKIAQSDKLCYINIHDSRGFCCETAEPMYEVQFEELVKDTFDI